MAVTKLKRLAIHNYKSLRYVELHPSASDFTVLVGRNGAGKSNLADAFDFIKTVYEYGLEHAVVKKGGYENIAFRKERRSRSAISFEVELLHTARAADVFPGARSSTTDQEGREAFTFRVIHKFSFKATGRGIRSEFFVAEEELTISSQSIQGDLLSPTGSDSVTIRRNADSQLNVISTQNSRVEQAVFYPGFKPTHGYEEGFDIDKAELLHSYPLFRHQLIGKALSWLSKIAMFQLTPEFSRASGVPTPNPSLNVHGENLPAVIDWLQRYREDSWRIILETMREIVPEIEDIRVDYLHTRTLGLFFKEVGVRRPWTSDEVSDGTIRSLAMLVACHDPRASLLLVEEPENSLHPWIIKVVMNSLRKLAQRKPVIITTHSPILLNSVSPEEVWVVYKVSGETRLAPLISFDPQLASDWSEGKYLLFDYIESGMVPQAVPSGVI